MAATVGDMLRALGNCARMTCDYFDDYGNAELAKSWDECERGDWLLGFLPQTLIPVAQTVAAARACIATRPASDQVAAMLEQIDGWQNPTAADAQVAITMAGLVSGIGMGISARRKILADYATAIRTVVTGAALNDQLEEVGGILRPKV